MIGTSGSGFAVVMAASVVLLSGCRDEHDPARTAPATLPDAIGAWRAAAPAETWDTETIFDYIDGHAEVYLAYGMRSCTSRRYTGPEGEPDIVADVFELASPADAFGVFTHDRDGERVDVGNDARFRYGWLSAWRGPYFVSVTAESDTEDSRGAVLSLGSAIVDAIPDAGSRPEIVAALPPEGLDPDSVRYLHHPLILNTHIWVGLDDPFELGSDAPAALGRYSVGDDEAFLLVVAYPEAVRADRAVVAFAGGALIGPELGKAVETDDGWIAATETPDGRTAFVLNGSSSEAVETLVQRVETGG